MNTDTLKALSRILDEVSDHPVLRAKERMVAAHERGGFDAMMKATEKRIKATKDMGKLEGMLAALKELAEHPVGPEAKKKLTELLAKVEAKIKATQEGIAEIDAALSLSEETLREDAVVESFLEAHLEECLALADSPEAFEAGVAALTSHAMAAGMFAGESREFVEEALTDSLLEFLPALIRAAGAVGRGVGKVGRAGAKVVAGAKAVGGAFKAGVKQGYHGKDGGGGSKPAAAKKAGGLARKVAAKTASKLATKKPLGMKIKKPGAAKPAVAKPAAPGAKKPALRPAASASKSMAN